MAGEPTEDESINLLNYTEDDEGDSHPPRGKKKYKVGETVNDSSCFTSKNNKLFATGAGVVFLVIVGVMVGVLSNEDSNNRIQRAADDFPYKELRLPGDIVPLKYRLYLHPNLTTFTVSGRVRILINCKKNTKHIIIHSKDNEIVSASILRNDYHNKKITNAPITDKIAVEGTLTHEKHEFLLIQSSEELQINLNYTVIIEFKGNLSSGLEGFYKSSYKTPEGETRFIATTHFEATAARAAFPCFDEPTMKAQFRIAIVRDDQHTCLSNMPLEATLQMGASDLKVDHFKESVKMSTYLVAFIVCDFAHLEGKTKNGVMVRVWAPPHQIEQAKFAMEVAPKVLDYYDTFFKVPFPLPKQDLVAVPDFAAGAMENWGLITYRATSLLYDKDESSASAKQWVAVVIAHELAHQWFGNLVTMKWWNDLWLNEGFAAYMEYIGSGHYATEWHMMEQFNYVDAQTALALDSHTNSHPISVDVKDPATINEIFDSISYDKGACLVRMMKHFIGSDAFHKGLEDYLKARQYANAESDDLWSAMAAAHGKINVKEVMDTWTLQMGYPVVKISRNPETGNAFLEQEQFLVDIDKSKLAGSKFKYKWFVPFTFKTEKDTKRATEIVWMNLTTDRVPIKWENKDGWIKGNADQIGFYRVNYDLENWNALKQQLSSEHKKLSTADRSNLIDDAFELARAGQLDTVLCMGLTAYLEKEKEYSPWASSLAALGYIGEVLEQRPGYKYYERYLVKILKPMVKDLKFVDDGPHLHKYLRSLILLSSVRHGDNSTSADAKMLFSDWMNNGKKIPPNLRGAVYLAGIRDGGSKEWDFMWKKQVETNVPSEQRKLMFALSDSNDPPTLKKYLELSMDNSKIRSQDSVSVISAIALNMKGRDLAWEFVQKNWDTLFERYGTSSFDFSHLVKACTSRFTSKDKLEEVQHFFKTHKLGSASRATKQAIAAIKNHISWLEKNEVSVTNWLKEHSS